MRQHKATIAPLRQLHCRTSEGVRKVVPSKQVMRLHVSILGKINNFLTMMIIKSLQLWIYIISY